MKKPKQQFNEMIDKLIKDSDLANIFAKYKSWVINGRQGRRSRLIKK